MENLTSVVRSLFSLSLTALPVMAAVLLARWLLLQCNAPKKYAFVLWGLVGFRLCCPITLSSMFSIFNAVRPVADITVPTSARNFSTVTFGGGALSSQSRAVLDATSLSENSVAASLTPTELALRVAAIIWLIGLAAILIYSVISLLLLRRRLAEATRMEDNIYECDAIPTPFVLGWIRPKIYLPCRTGAEERNYILLHERTHLRRGDPWWKLIGFLILAVHWWNPTAWLCWALMIRDMEMACDEAVIHTLGPDAKQGYSLSLVNFASTRRFSTAAPLAFGENDAKSRIKNVLRWKQTRAGVVFLSVALAAILIVACCTNANVKDSSTLTYADGQYSYSLGSDVRSMMLYYEVCTNGTIVSHDQIINENVGSDFPRNGSFSLGFTPQRENEHGTWRSFDWNYSDSSGASLSVSYTLNTSFRGYSSNTPDQPLDNLSMGEQTVDTVIQAHILDTNGDNGASGYSIHTYEETGAAENISVDGDTVVLVHLVLSPGDAIQLAQSADSLAQTLYNLKTAYVGDAVACGKLLKALDVQALNDYTMELFTSEQPYALQVNFTSELEDRDSLDAAMNQKSMVLLALIDNLDDVRWTTPSGKSSDFDRSLADRFAAYSGYADVRALGASVDGIQVLLDTFSTEGAVVGTLTNQQVDHGAPYPASFGTLGQFGCDLPSGAQYTLTAVTYLNGKSLGETELTSGSTDDLGSMFWLSCSMDMGRWDALYWTLYPEKEKNRAVELSVPLDGHGASYSFRDFSWFGQEAGGVTQAISARTPLMAFAVSSAGDDPIIVPCETLTSSSSLERFGSSNAVAAVVYLNLSAGHSAAESAGKTT